MAKVKLVFHEPAFEHILGDASLEMVKAKGESIAEACNSQSSWGGYSTEASNEGTRARARVWSYDNRADEARAQRLVRNLDA